METLVTLSRILPFIAAAPLSAILIIFIIRVFKDLAHRRESAHKAMTLSLAQQAMEHGHVFKLSTTKEGIAFEILSPAKQGNQEANPLGFQPERMEAKEIRLDVFRKSEE